MLRSFFKASLVYFQSLEFELYSPNLPGDWVEQVLGPQKQGLYSHLQKKKKKKFDKF